MHIIPFLEASADVVNNEDGWNIEMHPSTCIKAIATSTSNHSKSIDIQDLLGKLPELVLKI